jgi:hypothetical protein
VGNEADGGRFAAIEASFEMPSTPLNGAYLFRWCLRTETTYSVSKLSLDFC